MVYKPWFMTVLKMKTTIVVDLIFFQHQSLIGCNVLLQADGVLKFYVIIGKSGMYCTKCLNKVSRIY